MNITADSKGILTAGARTGSSGSYRPPLDKYQNLCEIWRSQLTI